MQLSTRQARIFRLAILLSSRHPVSAKKIITQLACSEPTLTRALKELRDSYSADIKYSKATHTYQLIESTLLDKKALKWMNDVLTASGEPKSGDVVRQVSLDKEKKKSVSLSLRMSVLRRIDQLAILANTTRSDVVELLVDQHIAALSSSLIPKGQQAQK
ncbi:tellurium resistance protein TerW [Pectobacteriaceae bacterium CE70]|uniref:Tellurium resistance protein TerW n=1 Tax=Serratia sp. (strain ATCC 39006) TaxID=104623 RepID=A0A2I5T805_SERS3|nr:HTH domain-containing protein [Serratia sp. ATCC 39006]WJV60659.1 tellurium resistance protein TerW [Pectobacteriaceae bacterium C52]WJV64924.1 tellurium resistance protein TerW [Pectobacteriaceae bacterium CE70]WJY12826.1 tellurium resistance protein TerW [Pectobacteriaceae bacterium C80]AUH00674.1 tellurium resistance protein TerW [Serratia sp. ATCC 39006]AUH04995.1 tellurium resistance protein TerW [Serratia sp. ATCC 39006]